MNNQFEIILRIIQIGKIIKLGISNFIFINRYRLHFQRESRDEIDRRKKLAQLPIPKLPEESLEIPIEQIYRPGSALDMPIRPPWTYDTTKEQLYEQERKYFDVNIFIKNEKQINFFSLGIFRQNLCEF